MYFESALVLSGIYIKSLAGENDDTWRNDFHTMYSAVYSRHSYCTITKSLFNRNESQFVKQLLVWPLDSKPIGLDHRYI